MFSQLSEEGGHLGEQMFLPLLKLRVLFACACARARARTHRTVILKHLFTQLLVIRPHLDPASSSNPLKVPIVTVTWSPAGTRSGPPAGPRKPSPTPGEPAPARQRRPAGGGNPPPTGARGAGVTQRGTSPSTRRSTPLGERRATSWTGTSGRGETGRGQMLPPPPRDYRSNCLCLRTHNIAAPSGSDLHPLI